MLERRAIWSRLVVPDPEAVTADGYAALDDVVRVDARHRRRHPLPSHQRLSGYAISREPLPRTRLGKYQRFLLPELYERRDGRRAVPPAPTEPATRTRRCCAIQAAAAAGRC